MLLKLVHSDPSIRGLEFFSCIYQQHLFVVETEHNMKLWHGDIGEYLYKYRYRFNIFHAQAKYFTCIIIILYLHTFIHIETVMQLEIAYKFLKLKHFNLYKLKGHFNMWKEL